MHALQEVSCCTMQSSGQTRYFIRKLFAAVTSQQNEAQDNRIVVFEGKKSRFWNGNTEKYFSAAIFLECRVKGIERLSVCQQAIVPEGPKICAFYLILQLKNYPIHSSEMYIISGRYMYRQFNIQQFYVLPTQLYLCVLCGSENKQRLFPYTTLTDWFL